jgi:hypothetical protein
MKNLHLIPTDKPTRLWTNNLKRRLELDEFPSKHPTNIAKNIYITNSEEIKVGDWFLFKIIGAPFDYRIHYCKDITDEGYVVSERELNCDLLDCKKIILTTDQSLDGVQAIDDEFLEWFVKNPSCESVEIVKDLRQIDQNNPVTKGSTALVEYYKIIIPKEEPKQEYYCKACGISQDEPFGKCHNTHKHCSCEIRLVEEPQQIKCYCGHTTYCDCSPEEPRDVILGYKTSLDAQMLDKIEPKQETLEKGVDKYFKLSHSRLKNEQQKEYERELFIAGAKWQAERMYSEEDMLNFAWFLIENVGQYSCDRTAHFEGKYLEQFKKK